MLENVLAFASTWWGLIGFVVLLILSYFLYGYRATKGIVVRLIFIAEEKARELCLETGKEKFQWVVEHGYQYLPAALKLFISKELFAVLVQAIFDKIIKWAEAQELRPPTEAKV